MHISSKAALNHSIKRDASIAIFSSPARLYGRAWYNLIAMTTIAILPETNDRYRAVAGDKESTGRTAGEALDALTSQLEDEESGTLVIIQNHKADQFFNAAQQERLTALMQLRNDGNLSLEEESELESLVEAELDGTRRRIEQELQSKKENLLGRAFARYEIELIRKILQDINFKRTARYKEAAELLDRILQIRHPQEVMDDSAQASGDELET